MTAWFGGDASRQLVTQERQGTTLICRANYPAMRELVGFLASECCADARDAETTEAAA